MLEEAVAESTRVPRGRGRVDHLDAGGRREHDPGGESVADAGFGEGMAGRQGHPVLDAPRAEFVQEELGG